MLVGSLTWPGRKDDSGETFCMQCAWQPGCRVKLLNKTRVALGALFMYVCGCKVCACICSHVSLHTHIPVCMNTQVCLWCFSDAQLRRDEFQMTENTTTTVSWIIFLETVHIFCFESYSAIIINLTWMQNFGQTLCEYTISVFHPWSVKVLEAVQQLVIPD